MNRIINRLISFTLIFSIIVGLAPVFIRSVSAAAADVIRVVSYRYNESSNRYELLVTWNGSKNTKVAQVSYYAPDDLGGSILVSESVYAVKVEDINLTTARFNAVINASDFRDDYIYRLNINMYSAYDSANPDANKTGAGNLYFMTKMTFTSARVEQALIPGVYETGTKPELKLTWNVPKIWYGGSFVDASTSGVFDQISSDMGLTENITALNYRVNISTKAQALDSGADIAPVMVNMESGIYNAEVLGRTSPVTLNGGEMSFNLLGRKDLLDTSLNTPPAGKLPHEQILPGTVLFMNIKPIFSDGTKAPSVITVGDPSRYNGSMVVDEDSNLAYTYTPVRFQLSRDASDNIYVKVYRINKDDGSLDMPNLYYSIQAIDTPNVPYGSDWPQKAKMTDEFFPIGSDYAITVITGVNPGTSMYYKVVVKTDSSKDRIESLKLQYQMSMDTTKPPIAVDVRSHNTRAVLNTGTVIDPETGLELLDENGNAIIVKSTDVVISWQKPKSWELLSYADKSAINFHFLINTNPDNLDIKYPINVNGIETEYLLNYRWVKMVNGASSSLTLSADGERLEYVLKGRELFRNEDGTYLPNPDKYPMYLLENMIYYLSIFTTKGSPDSGTPIPVSFNDIYDSDGNGVIDEADIKNVMQPDNISDRSVTSSFTTLPRVEREVPIARDFKAISEDIDKITGKNYTVLQFEKINVDWTNYTSQMGNNEYYDLYMSVSNEPNAVYAQIGSTDSSWVPADALVDDVSFILVNGKWQATVSGLRSNTTYYFKLKTRLDFGDPAMEDKTSTFTAVVPVTTRRSSVEEPDDATRRPIAPVDFKISLNEDGEPELTGANVAFDWSRSENDVTYKLIATTRRISTYANESEYINDPYYESFTARFGNNVLALDPIYPDGNFTYDQLEKICKYRVRDWLVPNNIYYFSIRAERKVVVTGENGESIVVTLSSAWVTVPVTTSLIDAPQMLETVADIQLGVSWSDNDPMSKAEDYTIYIKESKDSIYRPLGISQATIAKDDETYNGYTTYYGRIRGLKANTSYDIRAYKGNINTGITYFELGSYITRDDYHQIEVRWKGLPDYTYEIAIKTEGETDYVTLDPSDFTLIAEKNSKLNGTGYYMFYAKIKTMPVLLPGGTIIHAPLKSNMKYNIKVRSALADIKPSKYIGPVTARTQFNQDDYDREEDQENQEAKFLDKIGDLEEKLYWRVDIGNNSANKILLKGDRVVNAMQNNPGNMLTIDISDLALNYKRDIVYIPAAVIKSLNNNSKALVIKTLSAEYSFLPGTFIFDTIKEIGEITSTVNVKDVYLKMTITRNEYGLESLDFELKPASEINDLKITAIGSRKTDAEIKAEFHNKVYNTETGLVKQKLDLIKTLYEINADSLFDEGSYYSQYLVNQVEQELSKYIGNTLEGGSGFVSISVISRELKEFTGLMTVRLYFNAADTIIKIPYVIYDGSYEWEKLPAQTAAETNSVLFNIGRTGRFVLVSAKSFAIDVPSDHWAIEYINAFASKYDLSEIFGNSSSFSPDVSVNIKEIVLLYEILSGKTYEYTGLNIKQKAIKLGLDGLIPVTAIARDVSRQETASVFVKLYSTKEGLDAASLIAKGNIYIQDDESILKKHYRNVVMSIDLGIFTLDGNGEFNPAGYITRAQIITAAVRLLKLTGDM